MDSARGETQEARRSARPRLKTNGKTRRAPSAPVVLPWGNLDKLPSLDSMKPVRTDMVHRDKLDTMFGGNR